MIQLYGKLHKADPGLMPDSEFAKVLITQMMTDENWRYCRDSLCHRLKVAEVAGHPLSSSSVIAALKSKEIDQGIAPSVKAMNTLVQSKGKSCRDDIEAVPGA